MNKFGSLLVLAFAIIAIYGCNPSTDAQSKTVQDKNKKTDQQPIENQDDEEKWKKIFTVSPDKEEPVLAIEEVKKRYEVAKGQNKLEEFEKEFIYNEKFGYVQIAKSGDSSKTKIVIPATVILPGNPVEVFTCMRGFNHETTFMVNSDTYMTDIAIRAFVAKPADASIIEDQKDRKWGEPDKNDDSRMLLFAQWNKDGKTLVYRGEDIVIDRVRLTTMPHIGFIYAPSFHDAEDPLTHKKTKILTAYQTTVLVTVLNYRSALIYNALKVEEAFHYGRYSSNPYIMPEEGKEVLLIIRKPTREEMTEIKKIEKKIYENEK